MPHPALRESHLRLKKKYDLIRVISNFLSFLSRRLDVNNREEIFESLARELKKQGASKIAVFGSYAKKQENPSSDIDVIVDFSERKSLLDMVRIERELSEVLGIKVDLLTEQSISPYLIDSITEQMEVIYG